MFVSELRFIKFKAFLNFHVLYLAMPVLRQLVLKISNSIYHVLAAIITLKPWYVKHYSSFFLQNWNSNSLRRIQLYSMVFTWFLIVFMWSKIWYICFSFFWKNIFVDLNFDKVNIWSHEWSQKSNHWLFPIS